MCGPQSRKGGGLCVWVMSAEARGLRVTELQRAKAMGYHEYKALVEQQPAEVGCSFTGYTKQARAK